VVSDRERGRETALLRKAAVAGAHLAALSALAFAQPLFDILGKNPEFFAVRDSSSGQIVLFALALTLLPPAVLLATEILVGLLSQTAARILHIVFVAGLVAMIVLHALTKSDALSGAGALVAAAALGIGGAALYSRVPPVRTFMTFLVAAPVVFLALFLFQSPVSKLVFPEKAQAKSIAVKARTSVVVIVFDELSSGSLMDRRGQVDRVRFPNFASLARQSTWFRSATTVHPHTEHAVPSIQDGRLPKPGLLPVYADHSNNVFTLLGHSYRMQVIEALTHLCPPSLCKKTRKTQAFDAGASDDTGSLVSDAGIVYLHLLLPNPYAAHLPPISNTWGNFGGKASEDEEEAEPRGGGAPRATFPACGRNICRFAGMITADRKPTLYYLHTVQPHVPYLFLPSGKRYAGDVRVIPGSVNGTWTSDPWLPLQAEQRYLLQLAYADDALGILLKRLRSTGVYDRSLVIVTGDEGETFLPGGPRRNVTRRNLADVAFIPLFVKLPGEQHGRIDDRYARNMDVLPTIAHVLGIRLPWHVDGRSLIGTKPATKATVSLLNSVNHAIFAPLSELRKERAREVAQRIAVFGTGAIATVYRIGPHRELLGKSVGTLDVRSSTDEGVQLSGRELLANVDLSIDVLPSYITGKLTGRHPSQQDLAVAVNGTVEAVTRSYREFGETKFAALVPERSIREGANDVTVYAVTGDELSELRGSDITYTLESGALRESDGTTIPVGRAVSGEVRGTRSSSGSTLGGWAANVKTHKPADSIVVLVDGTSVFVGDNGNITRKDILKRFGVDKAGFIFRLPGSLLPAAGKDHPVRVFALAGSVASELHYLRGYPWSTSG
jgi:arginine exporter protein ArgO